jgi:hypothetical protein
MQSFGVEDFNVFIERLQPMIQILKRLVHESPMTHI